MSSESHHEQPNKVDEKIDPAACQQQDTEDYSEFGTDPAESTVERHQEPASFGRYRILEQLGEGGFGSVYRAFDPQLQRDVALKFPRNEALDELQRERFLREARAAASLRHPHIVCVFDAGQLDGRWFIASERIEGHSLRHLLLKRGALPPAETADLIAKLAGALAYAHGNGVVHRDVKPENILIDPSGDPHLADFGLARRNHMGDARTNEGVRMGTPRYMSPEQASGQSHSADGRSDLWSLGVVFHELLSGRRPELRNDGTGHRELALDSPQIPRPLAEMCRRCLQENPDDRYPSGAALADDLNHWLAANSASTPVGRSRWAAVANAPLGLILIGTAALLLLLSIPAASYWLNKSPSAPPQSTELRDVVTAGQWAADDFFKVRVPKPLRGTLLADVNYEFLLEIENRTAMRIEFSRIQLETFNADLAAAMGQARDQIHSSVREGTAEAPLYLDPQEVQTIPFACGQGLPRRAIVKLFHGQSTTPSEFRIEDVGVTLPIPATRHLSEPAIAAGNDALAALQTAREEALQWSPNARLHSAFAPERKVLHDGESGLSYVATESWVALFSSEKGGFVVEIDGSQIKTAETPQAPMCSADLFPTIGTQEAVRIADWHDLLRADWNGQHIDALNVSQKNPRLLLVSTADDQWTLVWFLPFLGPDSVPVTIDAIQGVPMHLKNGAFRPRP